MATTRAYNVLKIVLFILLFCSGASLIDPSHFISLDTAERFATYVYGYSSQENFDDLWVLIWIVCSIAFAVAGYIIILWLLRKLRR